MSLDALDGNIDGIEDLDQEEIADAEHPYGEVTAEDLGTDDLIDDGADAAAMVPDAGPVPVDRAMHFDDLTREETIEDRLAQEEPDPAAQTTFGE